MPMSDTCISPKFTVFKIVILTIWFTSDFNWFIPSKMDTMLEKYPVHFVNTLEPV